MAFAWIRPADMSVLEARPLLDIGCGDAQTLTALVRPDGVVVGADRSMAGLRAAQRVTRFGLVAAEAERLPFASGVLGSVLAGDLFHHLDDGSLDQTLAEIRRVLRPDGRLVAWWYARPGRPAPDAPSHPRPYRDAAQAAEAAGLTTQPLDVVATIGSPVEVAALLGVPREA